MAVTKYYYPDGYVISHDDKFIVVEHLSGGETNPWA